MGKHIEFHGLPPGTHTHFLTPEVLRDGVTHGGNLVNVFANEQPKRFPVGYVQQRYIDQHVASGVARIVEDAEAAPAVAPEPTLPAGRRPRPVPAPHPAEAEE
jgi:hypothetical protein